MKAGGGAGLLAAGLCLLGLHLAVGVVRLPGRVYGRRAEEVAGYREQGAAAYLLGSAGLGGADVVRWLQEHVPADAVVLWRGATKGPLEFLPGLLAPRLLVAEAWVPAGAGSHGSRPLARGRLPSGGEGVLVVVGSAGGLGLEVR